MASDNHRQASQLNSSSGSTDQTDDSNGQLKQRAPPTTGRNAKVHPTPGPGQTESGEQPSKKSGSPVVVGSFFLVILFILELWRYFWEMCFHFRNFLYIFLVEKLILFCEKAVFFCTVKFIKWFFM